jgi:hypothetical protein
MRNIARRDAVDPVVVTVNSEVAEPFAAGVTDVGLSAHVGANAGVGDTEQVNDTWPSNPFMGVDVIVNSTEDPDVTVALPGVALIPKS